MPRRGIDIRELLDQQDGEPRFPLFAHSSVAACNATTWDADLHDAEVPGTSVKNVPVSEQKTNKKARETTLPPHHDGGDKDDTLSMLAALKEQMADQAAARPRPLSFCSSSSSHSA